MMLWHIWRKVLRTYVFLTTLENIMMKCIMMGMSEMQETTNWLISIWKDMPEATRLCSPSLLPSLSMVG